MGNASYRCEGVGAQGARQTGRALGGARALLGVGDEGGEGLSDVARGE